MSQNPPQFNPQIPPPAPGAPTPLGYASPPIVPTLNLKLIATRQRAVMYCLLAYIFGSIGMFIVRDHVPGLALVVLPIYWGIAITTAVFIFMLAMSVFNTGAGILLGILTLVPVLGVIILLVVNQRATSILKEHGIRVGFLGANPRTVPENYAAPILPPPY